jgi:hypothetical protein
VINVSRKFILINQKLLFDWFQLEWFCNVASYLGVCWVPCLDSSWCLQDWLLVSRANLLIVITCLIYSNLSFYKIDIGSDIWTCLFLVLNAWLVWCMSWLWTMYACMLECLTPVECWWYWMCRSSSCLFKNAKLEFCFLEIEWYQFPELA